MPGSAQVESHAGTDDPARKSVLQVSDLTVSANTDRGRFSVVEDVSLELHRGRVSGLAGESGSGKTVTALSIMRLLEPKVLQVDSGSVRLGDADILAMRGKLLRRTLGKKISMVFQEPMTSLDPMMPIGTSISEVIRAHENVGRAAARERTIELLDKVGIPRPELRYGAYPFQMSGGMLQRVLIAMAISCGPDVLIADEPTTALDVTVQAQILRLLRSLADEGMAVLIVTHDMGVISEYTDDLVVMYAGQVVEAGPTTDVIREPAHPYTAGLLASVPSTRHRLDRLQSIPGRVPLLHEMPDGCRFAPRCPFARLQCEAAVPIAPAGQDRRVRCVRTDEIDLEGVE